MAIDIARRKFVAALGGAAVAWPLTTQALQPPMPLIGWLSCRSADNSAKQLEAFRQGLKEIRFIEGQNLTIESRWADDHYDRLPALAADLVGRHPSGIAATGGGVFSTVAAKAATTAIPIVFEMGDDPVKLGLVASLNRPGGNITGISQFASVLEPKRLGLLHDVLPSVTKIGMLVNPRSASAEGQLRETRAAAAVLKLQLYVVNASTANEIDAAFESLAQQGVSVLLVAGDPFFFSQRDQLVALAARHAFPATYSNRELAAAGGLMSYGTSITDAYRQVGVYAGRILKGEKPADLPVVQAIKFEFVINLKTAKTLGLTFPPGVLSIADVVIE